MGAPYASDAPSQSMVGSLRSWLERSRSEPTHPHRSRTRWQRPEPPTVGFSHSPPGSRRPNARSSRPWLPPLRRRVLPPSASAGPPRPQRQRQVPPSVRSAGRGRPQPHRRRPSAQSAGPASQLQRRDPRNGPSAGLRRQRRHQLQRPRSDRLEGPGRARSRTPHRRRARPTLAVGWGVRRSPEPNPDPLGQVSTGFG